MLLNKYKHMDSTYHKYIKKYVALYDPKVFAN